jgi:hypothetical protein
VLKPAPKEASTERAALAAAASSDERVEVTEYRSETTQVFADPDGHLTLESTAVPQRVHTADGQWSPVDLGLRAASDGSLRPGASVADVRFSGGGSGAMVTLVRDGETMTISWPGTLPRPTVSGEAATYANVLPDVDLVLRATDLGFAHVLVVKTPEAAANPKVKQVRLGLGGDAAFVAHLGGAMQAIAGGTLIAEATPAVMWDSARPAAKTASVQDDGDATSTHEAPGSAANVAPIGTEVVGDELVLRPDPALLDAPVSAFPLFLDPAWSTGKKRWAYATNNNANNGDLSVARVGKDPEGSRTYRSFFEFTTSFLKKKHIESAYAQMELDHSASCDDTWTHMYATGGIASTPRTKWSPQLTTWLASAASHAPEGDGCAHAGDEFVNFRNSKITAKLQSDANSSSGSSITLGFCACNDDGEYESSSDRWKKFFPGNAKLIVDYASYPGTPTPLSVAGIRCAAGKTVSIGTPEPTLTATYPDADESKNQTISASYEWVEVPANGQILSTTPRKPSLGAKSVAAGATTPSPKMTGLVKDKTYAIRTRATDPSPYNISGNWSGWCVFTVDTTVPKPPNITVNVAPVRPGDLAKVTFTSDNKDVAKFWYGWGADPLGSVAASSVTVGGVTKKTASVSLTAPRYGDLELYAYASDITQNQGNQASVSFPVGRPSEAIARWPLDTFPGRSPDAALADAKPAVGGDTPLVWDNGGPDHGWTPESRILGGSTAAFDVTRGGIGGWAKASVPALDTSKSFSAAAWVRLTDSTDYQTAVSKDGAKMSVFRLQYRPTEQSWCFSVRAKDVQDASLAMACAKTTTTGLWTHLAGVYDDNEMRLKLYVNGRLAASVVPSATWLTDWAGGWNAAGQVIVGRGLDAKYNGGVDYYGGQIADVQLFDRPLLDQDLVGQRDDDEHSNGFDEPGIIAPVQVGRWDFNAATWCYQAGNPDTCSAPDAAAWNRRLTLTPGTQTGQGVRDSALLLDTSHFATGEPTQEYGYSQRDTAASGEPPALQDAAVLRTDQAFTVSAWVRLDSAIGNQTIVSQDTTGPGLSGFDLSYRGGDGKWVLSMRSGPMVTDPAQQSSVAAAADDPTPWHLLEGVFDPGAAELRLYVDGDRAADPAPTGLIPWQATGPLVVGRSDGPGGNTDWLSGSLDNVTAWQGVLTDAAVHQLYKDESAEVAIPN